MLGALWRHTVHLRTALCAAPLRVSVQRQRTLQLCASWGFDDRRPSNLLHCLRLTICVAMLLLFRTQAFAAAGCSCIRVLRRQGTWQQRPLAAALLGAGCCRVDATVVAG